MKASLLSSLNSPLLGYTIRGLLSAGHEIDSVILDSKLVSEKNLGIFKERTGDFLPPIALSDFDSSKIPFFFVKNHNSPETIALIRNRKIDVLLNAGTPRILSKDLLDAAPVGILNCHPGMLPKFRGCTCVEWAIFLDEPVGNTVHFMSEGIDEGPIVVQEELAFTKGSTYQEIRTRVYLHGIDLMARGLKLCSANQLHPAHLSPQGGGQYFSVIENDKMAAVLEKVAAGGYRYQNGN